MTMSLAQRIAVLSLIWLVFASDACSRPAVFSEYSFEQAKLQAKQDHKFLLIDFMASWCPPCKKMEATTWVNDAVQAWVKENAIAIQVDVDKDEKTSDKFKIKAMPTMVLFTPDNADTEFGRQDGYLSSSELLQWLEGAKGGKTAKELDRELSNSDGTEIWTHMNKARELQGSGKSAEALDEYIWLWNNIKTTDPNLGTLRISLVPSEMKRLCTVLPAAKSKLAEMRDAAEKASNRHDWILLNGILDDNARSLAWFDKAKLDPTQRDIIRKNTSLLEPVLFSNSRWADAANFLYPDPLARIGEYYKRAEEMKHPGPDTEVSKDFDPFPSMVTLLYCAYVGANREAEAQKIADECLRLNNTQAMRDTLSNSAKGMRQARAAQIKTIK